MTTKLWCGFSILTYSTVIEGGEMAHIILKGNHVPRENPDEAWEDALRIEDEHDRHAKENGVARTSSIHTGICPPEFVR